MKNLIVLAGLLIVTPSFAQLPYQIKLSLDDVIKIQELVRFMKPDDFDVLDLSLSEQRTATCATYAVQSHGEERKSIQCLIGNYPLDIEMIERLSGWANTTTGSLAPVIRQDYNYNHLFHCQSDGENPPIGSCELTHRRLNPTAVTVKFSDFIKIQSVLRNILPKTNRYVVSGKDEVCFQTRQSDQLIELVKTLKTALISEDQMTFTQECAGISLVNSYALEMSVTGRGPLVDETDLERTFGILQDSSNLVQRYLVTGHGDEGGVFFCVGFKEEVTNGAFNEVFKKLKTMPFNSRRSEVSIKVTDTCQPDSANEIEPFALGERNLEREKTQAEGAKERAQRRAEDLKNLLAERAKNKKLYDTAFLIFSKAFDAIPKDDRVVKGQPSVYLDTEGTKLTVHNTYSLASGGVCELNYFYEITYSAESAGQKVNVSRPLKLICTPRKKGEKTQIKELDLGPEIKITPNHFLENEWMKTFIYMADLLDTGVAKVDSYNFTNIYSSDKRLVNGSFSVETIDHQFCKTEFYILREKEGTTGVAISDNLPEIKCYSGKNRDGFPINLVRTIPIKESDFPVEIEQSSFRFRSLRKELDEGS